MIIVIIGFKTIALATTAIGFKKEVSAKDKAGAEKDKQERNDKSEKEIEPAALCQSTICPGLPCLNVTHNTAYFIHYSPSFYQRITIPPPDVNLQIKYKSVTITHSIII